MLALPYDAFIFAPLSTNLGMLAVTYSNQAPPIESAAALSAETSTMPKGGKINDAISKPMAIIRIIYNPTGIPSQKSLIISAIMSYVFLI